MSAATITHGRHCTCSACERQDWSEPQLACCGMHGPSCPPVYAPLGAPGQPDPSAATNVGSSPGSPNEPAASVEASSAASPFDGMPGTSSAAGGSWGNSGGSADVPGCSECSREAAKPWPIFTVNYHGVECCAKCLTAMHLTRRKP